MMGNGTASIALFSTMEECVIFAMIAYRDKRGHWQNSE